MKFYLPLVLAGAALLTGCKGLDNEYQEKAEENDKQIQAYITANNLKPTKSPSGLYYQITTTNPVGRAPKEGDVVTYKVEMSTLDNKKIFVNDSSVLTRHQAFGYNIFASGVSEGLAYMKEGESGILLATHNLAFGNNAIYLDSAKTRTLPAYTPIRFDVKFIKTRNETEQILEYIADKKLTVTETTSDGLRYVRVKEGTGDVIAKGKAVELNYVLKSSYGEVIQKGDKFVMTAGAGGVIAGFDQGVQKMKVGEQAILIIPSALGYGKQGSGSIAPNVPLVYEIQILSAK
ncbi:FKBP-type peptidyl-prolyl cis-trans isomerase [Siphonobacter sp.]|uniref:FKBP-type peptidyl-prolyl cis-trans isomerase n=1 Tax=Siphonobacter sp. TaxID=1869184 RepID=UPI003B3AE27F